MVERVLQVTSKLFRGGAESFIMNVYRNIDRDRVQFDFLVFHGPREFYEDEIVRMGGRVFHVPVMDGANLLRRKAMLGSFFDAHHDYAAVHGHMVALGRDYLKVAADHGIARRFSHSHIADYERTPRNRVKQMLQKGFGDYATRRLACSRAAGEFMYPGRDFEVINNGIDINRFTFDSAKRAVFRAEHGFSDSDHVLGHVGRFELMKNHDYLIDVFARLARTDQRARLVLAGDGSLRPAIEKKVAELGLEQRVTFLGVIEDTPSFYDGVDCFVMPSLFEGLPFSAIEAQCSGLPCVLSTRITDECSVTDLVRYVPLEDGPGRWTERIGEAFASVPADRQRYAQVVRNAGYDIKDTVARLTQLYVGGEGA